MRPLLSIVPAVLLLAAGCTATDDDGADTAPRATPGSSQPPPEYRIVPHVEGSDDELEPGRWALAANGHESDTVLAELDVPAGFGGLSWFIGSDEVTVGYWLVTEVPTDPCHEEGRHDPGPTVTDLVDALKSQQLTTVSRVAPIELDGYDGSYLRITAPDLDYSSCQEGQVWYWETRTDGARHHNGPAGAIEHVWVFDVDGQRVVISGVVEPGAPASALGDLHRLVSTVRFVTPA